MALEHTPVLLAPILRLLDPRPGQVILDGTLGLGGHALALLPRILPGGRYLGLDIDEDMLAIARDRLAAHQDHVRCIHASYADVPAVLAAEPTPLVDHMLLDLGVNSAQLADAARGFSFDREGPLDMRFDRRQKRTALDLVNSLDERELADLFYEFGGEGMSRKIAKRICHVRHDARIMTTAALARAIESAYHAEGRGGGERIAPATRVFQALRVAVNRELDNLTAFLGHVVEHLRPGGRLAVVSFHSLEDGTVKRFLRDAERAGTMTEITRRPEIADASERHANPRSRSAKLRVAERLGSAA
ncbi:MAG: 16S rRNA (cytosine(1402)-N(4))-methyltransferase RsmH [Phycisphaerae bacterium]